jgi:hypothetical protein
MTSGTTACVLTAEQTGTSNYDAATDVVRTVSASKATATVSITWSGSTFDGSANAASARLTGLRGAAISSPAATLEYFSGTSAGTAGSGSSSAPVDAGTYTVRASFAGDDDYSADSATKTITIDTAVLTVTADDQSRQYPDPDPAFTVTYSGFENGDAASDLTGAPACSTTATRLGSGPATYPITCTLGTLASANYSFTFAPGELTVTKEDATVTNTSNALFFGTATATSATAELSATIVDRNDGSRGDIRKALVTFVNRDNGNAPLAGCINLPVGLVVTTDATTGTVSCQTSLRIGSTSGSSYTIGVIVSGWYTSNASTNDTVVTVAQRLATGFITGGGHLINRSSAGQQPGAVGARTNFGFNVKYTKSGTNLQGQINVIVRNAGRTYQIKGNVMSSLVTRNPCPNRTASSTCVATATFTGKANITDITDPLATISLGGNQLLTVKMTDRGEPGNTDSIAIQLANSNGGLWFSSNWDGTRTVEQTLQNGNLVVR